MGQWRYTASTGLVVGTAMSVIGCSSMDDSGDRVLGRSWEIGNGTVTTFAELARKPLPANYIHADFQNVDAVAPAMGNHLVDLTGPEFGGEQWKHSFIFGVYDGKITFYEEMLTRAHLLSQPNACDPIKFPPAVGLRGFYPTQSCIRYDSATGEYTVSLEEFVYREASAPEPVANSEAD